MEGLPDQLFFQMGQIGKPSGEERFGRGETLNLLPPSRCQVMFVNPAPVGGIDYRDPQLFGIVNRLLQSIQRIFELRFGFDEDEMGIVVM